MMDFLMPVFIGFMVGAGICAGVIGLLNDSHHAKYKQCRYYDQPIERCVTELGWEKK
jgi:hypothetical protein